MKILLVYPIFSNKGKDIDIKHLWEPLGAAYIAARLRQDGHSVEIFYPLLMGQTIEDAISLIISDQEIDILGISCPSSDFQGPTKFIKQLRSSGFIKPIIIGGHGASLNWKSFIIPEINALIIGEGENIFSELVSCIKTGRDIRDISGIVYIKDGAIIRNNKSQLIPDLDKNVFPARDIAIRLANRFGIDKIHIQIQTSRGCYGNCSFCSIRTVLGEQIGSSYRVRSAKNVIEEIKILHDKYGFKKFDFMDENFFPHNMQESEKKIEEFAYYLKKFDLDIELFIQTRVENINERILTIFKQINVKSFFVGIDSFVNADLILFNKSYTANQAKKLLDLCSVHGYNFGVNCNYRVKTGFINFTPLSTVDSLIENYSMFAKYNIPVKKLKRKLLVYPNQEALLEKITNFNPNFSEDNYFLNPKLEEFNRYVNELFDLIIPVRDKMRMCETICNNDNKYFTKIRRDLDEMMLSGYSDVLFGIKDQIDIHKLMNIKISDVTQTVQELEQELLNKNISEFYICETKPHISE